MTRAAPSFVTLTGCDRSDAIEGLRRLADGYPGRVEFGVLISVEKAGMPRFASAAVLADLRRSGLRLAAHLCGGIAKSILAGRDIDIDLSGFTRAQINLVGRYANRREVENAIGFGQVRGIRIILQCGDNYPAEARCDWLLDNSFGEGRAVEWIPDMSKSPAFCGVSGGLTAGSVGTLLARMPALDRPFWIDTESFLFQDGGFSTEACHEFLSRVYNW